MDSQTYANVSTRTDECICNVLLSAEAIAPSASYFRDVVKVAIGYSVHSDQQKEMKHVAAT